ncbi:GNAT family N-acetyltransferase [Fusibacter sp. Q10-2]|uniref:GNAT family N-acetyltransferase n=2 Tax=Fusibacter ferrireducens TaxID=2785058 RepID=A0ABR9ZUF5_9FIRM|nr:GNAT family N-acetyltransferase [Fusibacter ferrireducens]
MIRKAEKDDYLDVIPLIKLAIGDMANTYTGYQDEALMDKTLKALYLEKQSRFSYENVYIACFENKIAGQITAYPAEVMATLNRHFETYFNPDAEDREARLKALVASKEGFEGEYYIDSLAVYKAYRGLGFASDLIHEVERIAFDAGYDKLSLLVALNNPKAERLYEKLAFKSDQMVQVLGHPYKHLVKHI